MKSKMLGALALLTLIGALYVMQSADRSTPTADAATGSIAALNVGTCLTTDATVFKGDCTVLSEGAEGTGADGEDIRTKNTEVSTLYATYAHDPKTASDEPRAILENSDLLRISIKDTGRDMRSGVLIAGDSVDGIAHVNAAGETSTTIFTLDDDVEGIGKAIKDDLGEDYHYDTVDPDLSDTTDDQDVKLTHTNAVELNTASSSIGSSGNHTLNFTRGASTEDFHPGDFKVDDGAIVRFYGCLTDGTTATACTGGDARKNLKEYLTVDEDASNGEASGDTAPWLGVNASVPSGMSVIIEAIYYRTSSEENLIGNEAYRHCAADDHTVVNRGGDTGWKCDDPDSETDADVMMRDEPENVVYTDNEKDGNSALVVRAKSDGDQQSVNLFLNETGRFDGVYEGFLRLTDANDIGDSDADADGNQRDDWGREVQNATGATDSDADVAVLGVESGPVTIEYKDTDGRTRTLRIEIDSQPPAIQVTSPAHNSSSDDQTPDFVGTIEDLDSGLVDKSFRLVVDNKVDGTDGKNNDYALTVPNAMGVEGTGTDGTGAVEQRRDYTGYSDTPTFGITTAADLYNLEDDSCSGQDQCWIESEAYDDGANRGSFDDTIRLDLRESDTKDAVIRDMEYAIDYQAFVMDMAGNIGFSDSDPVNPRFINDLGAKKDRKAPNVLGYYSAHIINLDEKDPVINAAQSVTGYYGVNSDGKPMLDPDRSSVMVVFDGPIAANSVSNDTFSVELDDETDASVVDHKVSKNYVFLKLGSELASDATPKVDIAQGEKVEDMAGNETYGREVDEFEAKDGITPKLTVTLSGGSGSGSGNEGPEKLTRDQITVHVMSDEPLQGTPQIEVVCSTLRWNEGDDKKDASGKVAENEVGSRHDIDDYVSNRNVAEPGAGPSFETPVMTKPRSSNTKAGDVTYQYTCGYDPDNVNFGKDFVPAKFAALSRPGENWEYTWRKSQSTGVSSLNDGMLTVVAYARDRSRYSNIDDATVQNWGAASAEFMLDTALLAPTDAKGGDLQPGDGDTVKETRPFVLIEFNENTSVTLESVELDNTEIKDQFEESEDNRFVYWPESISQGDHDVEVVAMDAAGNEESFEYSFKVADRGDFLINLLAGWNAISVPADPVDTAIGAVFTDPAVTTVIGWDTQGWRIAMKRDGVWESNQQYGALNDIRAKYGYWVKSDSFVRQPVALRGGTGRDRSGAPVLPSIPTEPGWNFVGVIDQDGDQTEDHFGTTLQDSQDNLVTASEYLGQNYVRAYKWDATFSRFDVVRPDNGMTIGDGVWVYYGGGIAP